MDEVVEQTERQVLSCARQKGLFPAGCPVVLMVSGGGDSTALLHLMARLRTQLGVGPLRLVHINHLLRGQASNGDQRFVESLCEAYGIECRSFRVDVGAMVRATGNNMEALARGVRYDHANQELDDLCAREGVPAEQGRIVVAHTSDDRVETFYMRSIVGGGLGSLCGPGYLTGRLARPLLTTTREQLRDYLLALPASELPDGCPQEHWREDETNADTEHFRAYVRHQIVPRAQTFNPRLRSTLCRSLDVMAEEDALLSSMAASRAEGLIGRDKDGTVTLDMAGLAKVELPLQRRIVRSLVQSLLPAETRLDGFHIDGIVRNGSHVGFVTVLPTGLIARNEYGTLAFHYGHPACLNGALPGAWLDIPGSLLLDDGRTLTARRVSGRVDVTKASTSQAYVDLGATDRLWVRHPSPGDRIAPLGMGGHTRKVADVLTDAKVARRLRPGAVLVCTGQEDDDETVWLVGLRLDERYKVRSDGTSSGDMVLLAVEDAPDGGGTPLN